MHVVCCFINLLSRELTVVCFLLNSYRLDKLLPVHYYQYIDSLFIQVPDCNYKDFSEQPPLISTCDTQRVRDLLDPWISKLEPFVLVGPEGSGKSLLLQTMFKLVNYILHLTTLCFLNHGFKSSFNSITIVCVLVIA